MKFFLDTAELDDISDLAASGLVDGVTTNPSLVLKSGRPFLDLVREICGLVDGPVSAEVTACDAQTMIAEGRHLARLAPNVAVKVPLTPDGLKACRALRADDILVNVTLCFSPAQAILAAKAGASFVSPFVGRLDDIGHDGMGLIADICEIYASQPDFETEVLVASVRTVNHVVEAARLGADIVTLPPAILRQMFKHTLTDAGLERFLADWARTGQTIMEHGRQ